MNLNNKALEDVKSLHSCLKQLEFISCFETHLENRRDNKYPIEFLQNLETIKHQAQANTIKAICYYKNR